LIAIKQTTQIITPLPGVNSDSSLYSAVTESLQDVAGPGHIYSHTIPGASFYCTFKKLLEVCSLCTYYSSCSNCDRLCGLAVRVPGYRSRDPGSIPDATRFSEK
jgi:hypothetical protein